MKCCDKKTITIYKGFGTKWNNNNLVNVSFDSEIDINGFGAEFRIGNIVKTYQNIENGFSINLTAEESSTLELGALCGTIILIDLENNAKPFSTELPFMIKDWAGGDIKLDGFNITIGAKVQSNSLDIKITTNNMTTIEEETIRSYIKIHNESEEAHPYIQDLISSEVTNRENADSELQQQITDVLGEFSNYRTAEDQDVIDGTFETKTHATSTYATKSELNSGLSSKQDTLQQGAGIRITEENVVENSGVRNVATGNTNGTILVNKDGSVSEIAVKGLGSAAYTSATNYATAEQGALADTALQSGDYISELVNNKNYTTKTEVNGYIAEHNSDESAHTYIQGLVTTEVNRAKGVEGSLSSLNTTSKSNLVSAVNEVFGDILDETTRAIGVEGSLDNLTTNDKTNLVSGINEVNNKAGTNATNIGNLSNLTTGSKSNLVSAINEVDSHTDTNTANIGTLANLTTDAKGNLVAAINEVDLHSNVNGNRIGDLSSLATDVKNNLVSAINEIDANSDINTSNISSIQNLIPSQASGANKLADKAFVNSSISTNTANFIGTFNSVQELENYSGTLTNNDYAFVVGVDGQGNTVYDRYKYTTATLPASWIFEFELNNSSFTAIQWAAINSGITNTLVGQISTNENAIGDLSSLTTSSNTDLVSAINELDNEKMEGNPAISGATKCKITYDSKGLVTGGDDLSEDDIPSLSISKISGITANVDEINTLDGVTVSTNEINYLDGVNSSIQGQLDSKVNKNNSITGATKCKITYDSKGLVTGGSDLSAGDIPSITLSKISDVTASANEVNVLDGITATTSELNVLDGITATTSELNVLDGITATTEELNYVNGVTGSIQTQLDEKVPNTRTINGKALSSDISLNASDIGALPDDTVIPIVNDATLTIQKNGVNVSTFTANSSSDVTANIVVPTKISDLTNDSDFANKDLDNLTSNGKNIGNWSTNITNCITEIPQDINLELSSGTLTLKSGSKAYIPNGSGVFDTVTLTTDKTITTSSNGIDIVFVNKSGLGLVVGKVSNCCSGATDTLAGVAYHTWYDTTNNIIQQYNSAGTSVQATLSLPIAIITVSGGAISSIDQVFNGFGYIGSSVFVLPDVKGLIPNGRNADGTLKNNEIISSKVIVRTFTTYLDIHDLSFTTTGIGLNRNTYNEEENFVYNSGGQTVTDRVVFGKLGYESVSPYKVTSLNVKPAFHAVDYFDFKQADDNNVKITGNQSYSGIKTATTVNGIQATVSGSNNIIQKNTAIDITDSSRTDAYTNGFSIQDKNEYIAGMFGTTFTTTGVVQSFIQSRNRATGSQVSGQISVTVDNSGNITTSAPTPSDTTSTSSSQIATTGWVNTAGNNIVHRSGDETIAGSKTFTSSLTMQNGTQFPNAFMHKNTLIPNNYTSPGSDVNAVIAGLYSNAGDFCAFLRGGKTTAGITSMTLNVRNRASSSGSNRDGAMGLYINSSGSVYTSAPTPSSVTDNSTKIATTQWFNNKVKQVSTLPASPTAGVYYFVTE